MVAGILCVVILGVMLGGIGYLVRKLNRIEKDIRKIYAETKVFENNERALESAEAALEEKDKKIAALIFELDFYRGQVIR